MQLSHKDENSRSGDPDYSVVPVPPEGRMSKGSLTMAYWAICSAAFWLVVSATLAINFGTINTLVALLASVVVYGVLGGIISRFAIKTGFSVDLFSRAVFGKTGGLLATAIFFTTATYYCVFESSVIAIAIHTYFPVVKLWQAYLIVVLYSAPLVFGGVALLLDKLNAYLLPFYVIGLTAIVFVAVSTHGYSNAWLSLGLEENLVDERCFSAFAYYMGIAVNLMYLWDYARFGKKSDENYHARINFGIPFFFFTFLINGVIGIFLAASVSTGQALTETSIVFVILQLMGFLGLAFIWVSQTRINTANFQLAAVNFQAFLKHVFHGNFSKIFAAIVIGISVFVIMLTDVFSFLLEALAYQGIFVVAWVSIAITHILCVDHQQIIDQHPETDSEIDSGLWHPSFHVWIISSVIGLAVLNLTALRSFASPITATCAVLIYYVYIRQSRTGTKHAG